MKGPIARGTIRTTFVFGLRLAVQAGTLLLVARMLGPRQFGAFAGVASLAVILGTLSTFGTHLILLGQIAQQPVRRRAVLCYALPTTLLCGSLLLMIYLAICVLVLREAPVALHVLILLGAAEILLQPLISLCASEHHGLGRIARSQLLLILPLSLRLVVAVIIFVAGPADPLSVYGWGYALASIAALSAVLVTLPSPWPVPKDWRLPHPDELRNTGGYAALNITTAGPMELDKTLAARLLPLETAGVYAAAARVIGATALPVSAMTASALPRLFREGRDRSKHTFNLLRWMFGSALGYGVILAAVIWTVAPILDWIFGARYHGIGEMVRWLCLAIPGMAIRRVAGNVLMAFDRPWARFSFEGSGLITLVAVSIVATIHIGPVGMPIALCSSEWAMALIGTVVVIAESSKTSMSSERNK